MLSIFRETYISVQNSLYGQAIIEKSLKKVFWYWTKYLLIIVAALVLLGIFYMTNFLPGLPRIIKTTIPEGKYELKDGHFSSTIDQPLIRGDSEFTFILDTATSASALNPYSTGILLSEYEIIVKSEDGNIVSQTFKSYPSFSITPSEISQKISDNIAKIWLLLSILILILVIFFGTILWIQRLFFFLIWTTVVFLITKFFIKKSVSYTNTLKLVIYASILPFLFSMITINSSNVIFNILNLGIMAFFSFNWIYNLNPVKSNPLRAHVKLSRKHGLNRNSKSNT